VITEAQAREQFQQLGLPLQEIDMAIISTRLEIATNFAKKTIASIRREYLKGIITLESARVLLQQIGIAAPRINDYANLWIVDLSAARKQLSAQSNVKAFVDGLISEETLRFRLSNLNYDQYSINVFAAMGGQGRQRAVAKAMAQAAQTAAQQVRNAERLLKEIEADRRRAITDMKAHGTPIQIAKWTKKQLISIDDAMGRLRDMGWPQDDAENLLREHGAMNGESNAESE
jgi:hypothetical protein